MLSKNITRAIGAMAIVAIAFMTIVSPQREVAIAKPEAKPPHDAKIYEPTENAQLKKLTDAIGDLQQSVDDRLCDVETRFTSLEAPSATTMDEARLQSLENRVAALESSANTPVVKSGGSGGSSGGLTIAPVALPSVMESYSPRWSNYDGLSARNHATSVHGFDPSLSSSELARQHDAWHDQNGGDPPVRTRQRTVSSVFSSNCPGGVCPQVRSTTRTVQSRGGLLGFGVLGRRR